MYIFYIFKKWSGFSRWTAIRIDFPEAEINQSPVPFLTIFVHCMKTVMFNSWTIIPIISIAIKRFDFLLDFNNWVWKSRSMSWCNPHREPVALSSSPGASVYFFAYDTKLFFAKYKTRPTSFQTYEFLIYYSFFLFRITSVLLCRSLEPLKKLCCTHSVRINYVVSEMVHRL